MPLIWDIYDRLGPRPVRDHIIRRRHSGIWNQIGCDTDLVLVHFPKTGGTSLAVALYGRPVNHYPLRVWRSADPVRFATCRPISVLREPAERLLSAIRHCQSGVRASPADLALGRWLERRHGGTECIFTAYLEDAGLRRRLSRSILFKSTDFWLGLDGAADRSSSLVCYRLLSDDRGARKDTWLNVARPVDEWHVCERLRALARSVLVDEYRWYDDPRNVPVRDALEIASAAPLIRPGTHSGMTAIARSLGGGRDALVQ